MNSGLASVRSALLAAAMCLQTACFLADTPVYDRQRLIGTYTLNQSGGSERLELRADGMFRQILTESSGRETETEGQWSFNSVSVGPPMLFLHDWRDYRKGSGEAMGFGVDPYIRAGRVRLDVHPDGDVAYVEQRTD